MADQSAVIADPADKSVVKSKYPMAKISPDGSTPPQFFAELSKELSGPKAANARMAWAEARRMIESEQP